MKENPNIIVTFFTEGISRIKLNEPSNYNALSSKTIKSLINIFKSLNNDNKTKVIILEGSGKGFSAGHDLKEIRSLKNTIRSFAPALISFFAPFKINFSCPKAPLTAALKEELVLPNCNLLTSTA